MKARKAKSRSRARSADILTTLLLAVRQVYSADPSGAGVVVAALGQGEFYASVCRYREPYGKSKQVVASAKGKTAAEALRGAAKAWRDGFSAIEALDGMLGSGQ